jgi:hypothetical protein
MGEPSIDQLEAQTDSAHSNRVGIAGWFFWFFMLLLLYVLSSGPVLKVVRSHYGFITPAERIYRPIGYLFGACPPAGKCYWWYLRLWTVPILLD